MSAVLSLGNLTESKKFSNIVFINNGGQSFHKNYLCNSSYRNKDLQLFVLLRRYNCICFLLGTSHKEEKKKHFMLKVFSFIDLPQKLTRVMKAELFMLVLEFLFMSNEFE